MGTRGGVRETRRSVGGGTWVLAIALAVGVTGCGNNVADLAVGDCFNETDETLAGEDIANVPLVDCGATHKFEVYAVIRIPGDTYSTSSVVDFSDAACFDAFPGYVGRDYASSSLGVASLYPTPDSWAQGNRTLVCMLEDYDGGTLVGSMRGSGR